ncbi:aspartate dehydrogenase [Roseobacter weihaiensis]|uniref:aspartate dehydrogenase n=1 Tax=Roseobacter weihaiensis TaxID=2763262 RepID=UPI001D0A9F59|nr:aspartate dehydrogenase [Roseobacter sp. H9]
MPQTIVLIGYGAIAAEVCKALSRDAEIRIAQVLVRPGRQAALQAALPSGIQAISSLDDLHPDTDFVLECAGHDAVRQFGPDVLRGGVDFGVLSAGALADDAGLDRLRRASQTGAAQLILVSGAIGGIDALAAAGDRLDKVTYLSRKPPLSWRGSPAETTHNLACITAPTVLFTGTAREAALTFPKNANVVATVALAGIGFDATEVTLMADPDATGNTHRIKATGPLFDLDYATQGAALPANPKTSALTAYSAVRALRHRGIGVVI